MSTFGQDDRDSECVEAAQTIVAPIQALPWSRRAELASLLINEIPGQLAPTQPGAGEPSKQARGGISRRWELGSRIVWPMDALVDDFIQRRPQGLERVYSEWSVLFVSVARQVTGEATLAEDCVHDALLRVWRAPNRFDGDRQLLRAYLAASVRNEALAAIRSDSRRGAREERAARLSSAAIEEAPVVDPVESERLRVALERLPEEQRQALVLAYYGNKTHVEVAERLNVPLGTVKSRIAMALRKVRVELADAEGRR